MPETTTDQVAAAEALVSGERVGELCRAMVDIPSPTGEEQALARHLADTLDRAGLDAATQEVEGTMVNAHGRLAGRTGGPSLLLYAPIDTVTVGAETDDLPWAGPVLRSDMSPGAEVRDGMVVGLGAHNPKGHGACVLAAVEALTGAGIALDNDLLVGFGAGGMPSNARRADLSDGHGRGCAAIVDLLKPSRAVIAKTGWAVSWTEVGLAWFEVSVEGSHTYVGSRHLLPYRNAIADAGMLIAGLERWFEQWSDDTGDALIAPQGVVAAIEGGWPHMPAFTTALCRFWVDLRLHPDVTADNAAAAFGAEVARLSEEIGATADWRQTVAIPGTSTDPADPVIRSAIAAWESISGRQHQPIPRLSGATDANILRSMGVPTARVGLPKVARAGLDVDFALGMNAVDIEDMVRLTRLLIRVVIDSCGVKT